MEKVAVTFKLPAFGHLVIEAHSAHSSSITQSIIRSVNREMWTDWNVNVCKEGWDRGENETVNLSEAEESQEEVFVIVL